MKVDSYLIYLTATGSAGLLFGQVLKQVSCIMRIILKANNTRLEFPALSSSRMQIYCSDQEIGTSVFIGHNLDSMNASPRISEALLRLCKQTQATNRLKQVLCQSIMERRVSS
jgi:hypothetical protein